MTAFEINSLHALHEDHWYTVFISITSGLHSIISQYLGKKQT